jgi:DNA-binding GntR family transcriptional regulator
MTKKTILNLASLKDQVYEYLRSQMRVGELMPGDVIDMNVTSQKLGVSKTPLRDALVRLETEGFVNIMARKGVLVNVLTVEDIREIYQILGALESTAIIAASGIISKREVDRLIKLNEGMRKALEKDDFSDYYKKNLKFHDVFLELSGNNMLRKTADVLKKRLYDFPRRAGYVKEWEQSSIKEHQQLVAFISAKKYLEAADFIRDVHWSFNVQERFIKLYYSDSPSNLNNS